MESKRIFAQTQNLQLPGTPQATGTQTPDITQSEIKVGSGNPITKRPMTGLEAKSYVLSNPGPKAVMANIQETLSSIGYDPKKVYSDTEMASVMNQVQTNLMNVFGKLYRELGVKV